MLSVRNLSRHYTHAGTTHAALRNVSFDVARGEVFTLLGPSGCGKTTLLRSLAGLDEPDEGSIHFSDTAWVDHARGVFVAPRKRGIGLVFQSYAVWPHLSVFENIAYPLRRQRKSKAEIDARVNAMLATVGLDGLASRSAQQLSGGQQQRVAMGRALASEPDLLLLDEPFSNLDVHLRQRLREEIRQLKQRLNLTIVLVTHDQEDAFALSDRIAVMNQGRIEQIATPEALHDAPASAFVHDFIGRHSALQARVVEQRADASVLVRVADATFGARASLRLVPGELVSVRLRPGEAAFGSQGARATVLRNVVHDDRYQSLVQLEDGQTLTIYQPRAGALAEAGRGLLSFSGGTVLAGQEQERETSAQAAALRVREPEVAGAPY
ncbi:ABC transporter ATP-binding protein [Paraburkholderia tropica]|uniref:ABC transporter ATP-binding protein n=1 Tax=Paraburkholderia tropica TaxID=92647 RepID=UPI0007EDB355|nr:ABC transporter ATP-binding protein [Paraburkholderia tropica]OBR46268.1 hypothetical protein A6456_29520 [Paraburkholderia tropica]